MQHPSNYHPPTYDSAFTTQHCTGTFSYSNSRQQQGQRSSTPAPPHGELWRWTCWLPLCPSPLLVELVGGLVRNCYQPTKKMQRCHCSHQRLPAAPQSPQNSPKRQNLATATAQPLQHVGQVEAARQRQVVARTSLSCPANATTSYIRPHSNRRQCIKTVVRKTKGTCEKMTGLEGPLEMAPDSASDCECASFRTFREGFSQGTYFDTAVSAICIISATRPDVVIKRMAMFSASCTHSQRMVPPSPLCSDQSSALRFRDITPDNSCIARNVGENRWRKVSIRESQKCRVGFSLPVLTNASNMMDTKKPNTPDTERKVDMARRAFISSAKSWCAAYICMHAAHECEIRYSEVSSQC